MTQRFNEETLSSYMDGEIDISSAGRIETLIDNDPTARRYIIDAVKTTARLRASLNETLHEKIPDRLLSAIFPQGFTGDTGKRKRFKPLLRIAAMVSLLLLGFGSGIFLDRKGPEKYSPLPLSFPAVYNHVISEALEYDISGIVRKWEAPNASATVQVIPVKTYRDSKGTYYREYDLDVITKAERNRLRGLSLIHI